MGRKLGTKRLSRSVRTHIRREKARIRRSVEGAAERERLVAELRARFGGGRAKV